MRKRSHHQPGLAVIPMSSQNKQHIELTFYADLAGFISTPSDTAYNRLLRTLDVVTLSMVHQDIRDYDVYLRSAKLAMAAVFARHQQTGKVTVLDLEALTLRAAAPFIEAAIKRTRLEAFKAAHACTKALMRTAGAPVEA